MNNAQTTPEVVSVLMVAYNAERTIEESIRSVMQQTFQQWRLVVVDDGSTDDTPLICKRLSEEDNRIAIHSKANGGVTKAALYGLDRCHGKYVARLDADDLAKPERLEKQVKYLTSNPGVKLLGTWMERISVSGEVIDRLQQGPATRQEYEDVRRRKIPFWLLHSSIMAEREIFMRFKYRFDDFPCDDAMFWNRVALEHPIQALPEYLTCYRISLTGSHSSNSRSTCFQTSRLEYNIQHETDLTSDQFRELLRGDPMLRFRAWLLYTRKHSVRMAGLAFYSRQPFHAFLFTAMSVGVNPVFTLRRIATELSKRLRPERGIDGPTQGTAYSDY